MKEPDGGGGEVLLNRLIWYLLAPGTIILLFVAVVGLCTLCHQQNNEEEQVEDEEDEEEVEDLVPRKTSALQKLRDRFSESKSPASRTRKSGVSCSSSTSSNNSTSNLLLDYDQLQPSYELTLPQNLSLPRLAIPRLSIPRLSLTPDEEDDTSSIPDAPTEHAEELGNIYFSISYVLSELTLKVHILKATNLPAKDIGGNSDPYATVALLPDKRRKAATNVRKRNLNPVWNEVLKFEGYTSEKLMGKTLYLKVYDYDRIGRDDEIGEVRLMLSEEILHNDPIPFVKKLSPCKKSCQCLGSILVSLCYQPTLGMLQVQVMQCNGLNLQKNCVGKGGLFVKVYMMHSTKKLEKRKTEVVDCCTDPVWNENMEFSVPFTKKRDTLLVFEVRRSLSRLPSYCLGHVSIGQQTRGQQLKHWMDAMYNPRKAKAVWHSMIKH